MVTLIGYHALLATIFVVAISLRQVCWHLVQKDVHCVSKKHSRHF